MMLRRYVIFSAALLLSSFAESKPLRFVTFPIPLMVESSTKGIFIDLTKEIAKRNNMQVKIEVLPIGKSILAFSSSQADALFPALDAYTPKKSPRSVFFYQKTDFVFYKKGQNLASIKDLEGKRVGLTFRYPYAKELTENRKIRFEYSEDDVTNMKKLGQGRIDAFVVEERSGLQALNVSGAKDIIHDAGQPLSRQDVYYAFQDNSEGRAMAQKFTRALEKMKEDGAFDRIMINHLPKLLE